MLQFYNIIMWKEADAQDKSFEEIARETYDFLGILREFPKNLQPNFYTAYSKKSCKAFSWDYEDFSQKLKKGINKEGKTVFEDMGYMISMFSDMNDDEASSFILCTGARNADYTNTFIMDLPLNLVLQDKSTGIMISDLFERLIMAFKPYWGCVRDNVLSSKYESRLSSEGKLVSAQWLNYWPKEIAQTVGEEKIAKIMKKYPSITYKNDIFSLRDTAIDAFDPNDVAFFENVQKELFGTLPKEA